jgi:hypothetical protein
MPSDAALKENARELYDAAQVALRYLTFSALDRSPVWGAAGFFRGSVSSFGKTHSRFRIALLTMRL